MGLSVLNQPAAAGGGIKSVQRGSAGGAGNVTITAVDITKAFVTVFGTTSSGTVAASATINAVNLSSTSTGAGFGSNQGGNTNRYTIPPGTSDAAAGNSISFNTSNSFNGAWTYAQNFSGNTTSLTGGSNNLVAAVVQGYLSNSTTLVVSGACRYEVVEFN